MTNSHEDLQISLFNSRFKGSAAHENRVIIDNPQNGLMHVDVVQQETFK